jgi:hypothetical protein
MNRALDVRRVASWVGEKALSGVIENFAWWGLVSLAALLLGSGFVAYWFRSALSDFFQADVRVWHFIVVLLATGLAAYFWRRWLAAEPEASTTVERRQYIPYKGVDWDRYGKAPRCPKDHTYLAWVGPTWGGGDDVGLTPFTSAEGPKLWPLLGDGMLNFVCLKCHGKYDLNGDGNMIYLHSVISTLSEAPD